jgi:hypoxanthine phosphoribosyltransferase
MSPFRPFDPTAPMIRPLPEAATVAPNAPMIRPLFDAATVQRRIGTLAAEVAGDYPAGQIVFLGILTGAAHFMMELIASLPASMQLRVVYDFVDVSSYAGQTSTGTVQVRQDCSVDLRDQHVLIVDGVVDTGLTLQCVLDLVAERQPSSIRVCALVDKPARRSHDVAVDYCGFTVEDLFIVGCGMDYDQRYRALDYIGVLEPQESAPVGQHGGGNP